MEFFMQVETYPCGYPIVLEGTTTELLDMITKLHGLPCNQAANQKCEKPQNHNHKWEPQEDTHILEQRASGTTYRQIAENLGRSQIAIQMRIAILRKKVA